MPLKWELLRNLSGLFKLKMQTDGAVGGCMELRQCLWSLIVFHSSAVALPIVVLDESFLFLILFEKIFCLISV